MTIVTIVQIAVVRFALELGEYSPLLSDLFVFSAALYAYSRPQMRFTIQSA